MIIILCLIGFIVLVYLEDDRSYLEKKVEQLKRDVANLEAYRREDLNRLRLTKEQNETKMLRIQERLEADAKELEEVCEYLTTIGERMGSKW